MLFNLAPFVSLAGPLDGANGGPLAWVDDQTTYNFTTSPEYGDSSYPLGYNALWSPQWQHMVSLLPSSSVLFEPFHDHRYAALHVAVNVSEIHRNVHAVAKLNFIVSLLHYEMVLLARCPLCVTAAVDRDWRRSIVDGSGGELFLGVIHEEWFCGDVRAYHKVQTLSAIAQSTCC